MKFLQKTGRGQYYSARALKKRGVSISGGGIFVERSADVRRGAYILGPCYVCGNSVVEGGARILPFSRIENSVISRGAEVYASTLISSKAGKSCTVGPYALLRGADIGDNCRVGDFVEIKNSVLGKGCKAAHHAYIGDADLGSGINIGCGVVFANYDGKSKRRSVVEDNCFIGCNCNIVAPVHIGEGAYIAAGTTVTKDVASKELCIGRAEQRGKAGGAAGRYKNG